MSSITVGDFAEAVFAYCTAAGASVTSWYRTAKHNAAVGGVASSHHLTGLAVDVVYDSVAGVADRGHLAATLGLVRLVEKDHDHLQAADTAT